MKCADCSYRSSTETDLLLLYKYSVKLSKYYISARVFLILKLNTLSFRHVEGTPLGLRVRGGVGATKAWQGHRGGQRPRGSCHWSGSKPAIQSCKHAVQTPMWETRLRRTRQEIVQEFTRFFTDKPYHHIRARKVLSETT